MRDPITLVRPGAPCPDSQGVSAALPPDLLDQVRGRVRLLAMLCALGFAIGPVVFLGIAATVMIMGGELPSDSSEGGRFFLMDVPAVAISAALWWRARDPNARAAELLREGLLYEVAICFIIGVSSFWRQFELDGQIHPLTWIPAIVILFPLIMPGPPRRMLWGAIAAGAMAPVSLAVLDLAAIVHTTSDDYLSAILNSGVAVFFAYIGARTIYGLGKQVAEARQMGSYELEERLGSGGMGEVWRARHRMLARPAAIKLIRPEILTGDRAGPQVALQRFEREAQATAGLRSPHTVELYDFGAADDGTFYYVMELLNGLDAATLVERFGPLQTDRAVFLLQQVCRSLSEAHAAGLVHRDIKPANIFICRYGEDHDFVKVLDFGLVTGSTGGDEPAEHLTAENVVGGTPAFIAPEQALGKTTDGRADIYALGCVAYWLLTGQYVFTGETPMEVLTQHVSAQPVPMSRRSEQPIPPWLERVVMACLEKEPGRRPASARELLAQLDQPPGATPWTQDRAQAWWEGHLPL